ncbi:hypothetical protein Q5425_37095 [Amycolatopsis sp. A133]|uniref:hypothetical protein n=1 Tax=Amycolatopsis sp. A133 TaxID=3064472 RepID=UPI0027E995F5|nr:hypothetical protein [Amycolatopsis sp. A133]MDQ7809375.1 hypothetical protein [Amycolatopsis sp. A133]
MALLTAQFAIEQALASLLQAIRGGRTTDIAQWAALATEAVMEAARLVEVPAESAGAFTTIRDSVINALDVMATGRRCCGGLRRVPQRAWQLGQALMLR